ncbi:thioredoxin fold domain-containing protein [Persephonella atlantica]|uniref:Thioredoxin fold domain-containing protein n=1 Tax=Persephonella atlantica TaxID=2699429 RepID=A0ABS1GK74_9AQUI|nr:thioredoxin fold domain-containing protein [Persephonella atlantica]MBK3333317.1 thioredoxin fold domain-containing protein [Persephonella atlantica]
MKKFFILFFSIVFILSCQKEEGSKKFAQDPEPIIQDALKNKKILILIFESESCQYCEKLHREVLNQPDFKEKKIKNGIEIAIIDVNGERMVTDPETGAKMEESALAFAYKVTGYPTIIVFDPKQNYKVLYYQPGFIPKQDFMDFLDFLGSGCYQKTKFEQFIENGKKC